MATNGEDVWHEAEQAEPAAVGAPSTSGTAPGAAEHQSASTEMTAPIAQHTYHAHLKAPEHQPAAVVSPKTEITRIVDIVDDNIGEFDAAPAASVLTSTARNSSSSSSNSGSTMHCTTSSSSAAGCTAGASAAPTPPPRTAAAFTAADADDDFGDFNTALPEATPAAPAPPDISHSADLVIPAAKDSGDDEFGDFGDAPAPPVAAAASSQLTSSGGTGHAAAPAEDVDDEFGDFDDASAPVAMPAAAAQPVQPTSAVQPAVVLPAAAAEARDILQLTGQDFVAAVLDAWQMLGAPAAYSTAAATHADMRQQQQQHVLAVSVSLSGCNSSQLQNSVLGYNGIPMHITHVGDHMTAADLQQQQQQWVLPAVACSADLDWQGSASEARLIAGLGLTQAVERALAQMDKDAAAAAAIAAAGSKAPR